MPDAIDDRDRFVAELLEHLDETFDDPDGDRHFAAAAVVAAFQARLHADALQVTVTDDGLLTCRHCGSTEFEAIVPYEQFLPFEGAVVDGDHAVLPVETSGAEMLRSEKAADELLCCGCGERVRFDGLQLEM